METCMSVLQSICGEGSTSTARVAFQPPLVGCLSRRIPRSLSSESRARLREKQLKTWFDRAYLEKAVAVVSVHIRSARAIAVT